MASNPSSSGNVIYYQLVLDAQMALAQLELLKAQGLSFDGMVGDMQEKIQQLASTYGVDVSVIEALFNRLNTSIALTNKNLDEMATKAALRQAATDLKDAEFAGLSFESTLRMIEGVIVSMAVFQGFQMIAGVFQQAIASATQYYQALQNITAAQSAMAQQGVNVTNQQLLDIVDQLHQKWQTISETDMTSAVAQAGLMASEYHLSVDQMTQLANEAAILHQLDPSKPMADYVTQLAKALEGGRSLAANGDQIAITNTELLDKAKQLGLVAENYKGTLSDQVKIVSALAIEWDRLGPEQQKLLDNQNSLLGQSEKLSSTWQDFLRQIGTLLAPVAAIIKTSLLLNIEMWMADINKAESIFERFEAAMITGWTVINEVMKGHFTVLSQISTLYDSILAKIQAVMNQATTLGGTNLTNTPVNPFGGQDVTGASSIDESKLTSILDSLAKDYQTYYDDVQKATEEFNNRMQDLQDRYNLDVQKTEQDFALRVANEKQDFRLKELQSEQDFQLKMKELQARFQMDLEDALRKRDAEAVIKTIEKYNNEKSIDQQQEALKLQQMKQEEALKLKQMKEEEALRLQQMKAEFQLQQQEAQRAYQQQLQDLQQALDQKIQEEAVKAQQDLGLNQTSIEALYKLFSEYYGPDGKFAQEQQGAYIKMIEQSQGFVDEMAAIMQEYGQVLAGMGATINQYGGVGNVPYGPPAPTPGRGSGHHPKFAQGGMALAASATDVTFGDAGPELAMFLPLNSTGPTNFDTSLGGGINGALGAGGFVTIALQLSGDMEARIVNTTLTHAALQIERVFGAHG